MKVKILNINNFATLQIVYNLLKTIHKHIKITRKYRQKFSTIFILFVKESFLLNP